MISFYRALTTALLNRALSILEVATVRFVIITASVYSERERVAMLSSVRLLSVVSNVRAPYSTG